MVAEKCLKCHSSWREKKSSAFRSSLSPGPQSIDCSVHLWFLSESVYKYGRHPEAVVWLALGMWEDLSVLWGEVGPVLHRGTHVLSLLFRERRNKDGAGCGKLNTSEWAPFFCFLRRPRWLFVIEIAFIFNLCFSLFHKCKSRGCSFLCWFPNIVIVSKSVLIYSYENTSTFEVKCNPIKNDTGLPNGEK